MEQIIIDGVNLSEVKIRYDALQAEQAALRNSIRKGASKYIADAIKDAKVFLNQIIEAGEDYDEDEEDVVEFDLEDVSSQALALLRNAKFVSDVSGVTYYLPYYNRQGGYCPDGELYTSQLDQTKFDYDSTKSFMELGGLLDDMESEVAEWNTSYC